jgi:regulator of Ty1 transposition protein 109
MPEVSPNPFPEPVTSLETYYSHIYGSICVSNAAPSKEADVKKGMMQKGEGRDEDSKPQVTVLTARKKKRTARG